MSSKSVSLIRKHKSIKDQLRNFPSFGTRSSLASSFTYHKNQVEQQHKQKLKKKPSLQKGRSLDVQRNKIFQNTFNNFKKTTENINFKSIRLIKKNKNKLKKLQSFSRVSLISSQNQISNPSTTAFQYSESQIRKLNQQNIKYKEIIEKQIRHIKSLQCIISGL